MKNIQSQMMSFWFIFLNTFSKNSNKLREVKIMKDYSELFRKLDTEEKKIFNLLQKQGQMAKSEILSITNMKLTTLNYIMKPLEEKKIIVQKCIGESTGGRKPILYDVNICDFYIIGVDISRTYTQIVIVNLKMEMLYKEMFYMDSSCSPLETVNKIAQIINEAYKNLRLDTIKLLGVGLGTVGPIDIKNGIIISPVNFPAPGWSNIPIKAMLEEKLGCTVVMESGSNSAAVAEHYYGSGKGFENISYFNCGVGIRTGTITSGNLIRTANDEEDAFGHMIIDIDGEKCKCGNYGCIECYSSISSIIKKFTAQIKKGKQTSTYKSLDEIKYKDICIAAQQGDDLAKNIISEAALVLGTGLVNYINLLSPKVVILSGPLIMNSKLFYEVCVDTVLRKLYSHRRKNVIFSKGGYFKENAMAVGAAAMVMEKFLE